MSIQKISATKLEQFINCPYGYSIKYIKRKQAFPSSGMLLGNMVHKILEDINRWVASQSLLKTVDELEISKVLITKAQQITNQRYSQYMKNNSNRGISVTMLLHSYVKPYITWLISNKIYTRDIEPEKTFYTSLEEVANTLPENTLHKNWTKYSSVVVTGKMDLFIHPNIVIDFKTQNPTSFTKSWTNNFQVMLYTLIFNIDMTFMYMFLNKNKFIKDLKIHKAGRAEKFNKVISLLEVIESTKVFTPNTTACRNCIYRSMCDKHTRRRGNKKKT